MKENMNNTGFIMAKGTTYDDFDEFINFLSALKLFKKAKL